MRDLGTSLRRLVTLRAERCSINGLDGVSALPVLRELFLAFNAISDVAPLLLHDSLEVLDLEANALEDDEALMQLGTCARLRSLSLEDNPIASQPEYRAAVAAAIPQLRTLDDLPLQPPGPRSGSATPVGGPPPAPPEPRRPTGGAACPPRYPSHSRLLVVAPTAAPPLAAGDESTALGPRSAGSARAGPASDAQSARAGGGGSSSLGGSVDSAAAGGDARSDTTASTASLGSGAPPAAAAASHLMRSGTAQAVLGGARVALPTGSPTRAVHSAPYHRPGSAARPGSAMRPGGRGGGPDDAAAAALKDTASSLTHGDGSAVFVGSAVQSLRQRRASTRSQAATAAPLSSPVEDESDSKSASALLDSTWPGAFPPTSGGALPQPASRHSLMSARRDSNAASVSSFGSEQSPRPRTSSLTYVPGGALQPSLASPGAWGRPSVAVAGAGADAEGKDFGSGRGDAELSILDVLDEGRRQDKLGTRSSDHLILSSLSPPQPARNTASSAALSRRSEGAPAADSVLALEAGAALSMPDADLVALLRRRPKDVPQLHSREAFRRFFARVSRSRMLDLLRRAFASGGGESESAQGEGDGGCEARVQRRIELLEGVLGEP